MRGDPSRAWESKTGKGRQSLPGGFLNRFLGSSGRRGTGIFTHQLLGTCLPKQSPWLEKPCGISTGACGRSWKPIGPHEHSGKWAGKRQHLPQILAESSCGSAGPHTVACLPHVPFLGSGSYAQQPLLRYRSWDPVALGAPLARRKLPALH